MTRVDRLERALWALIDRMDIECKAVSPGRRNIEQLVDACDLGLLTLPDFNLSLLRGIVDMKRVLGGDGSAPVGARRPAGPRTPKRGAQATPKLPVPEDSTA